MGVVTGGGGGGGGPAAGTYLPVAHSTGVTVDSTTYNDTVKGSGKLTTLVFPSEQGAFALAISGDAFPRMVIGTDPTDVGILGFGDGTVDVFATGAVVGVNGGGGLNFSTPSGSNCVFGRALVAHTADAANTVPLLSQLSPRFTVTSGALPTVTLSSGTGAQVSTSRDAETVTPFTGDATNNAATCKVELSPDNVTYSTLNTMSIAAALNLSGALDLNVNVRVPAGWYLKLTATHGTIGTTTYY